VQVLTHVREKRHHVAGEAARLRAGLSALNVHVAQLQGALVAYKRERDAVRASNDAARAGLSFALNDALAVDFEARKAAIVALQAQIAGLQQRHKQLLAVAAASGGP